MQTTQAKTDRYISYKGIDCEGNSKRLMAMLCRHLEDPAKTNAFWEKFQGKLAQIGEAPDDRAARTDELFLIHAYINNLEDFFEQHKDEEALQLLRQVEEECC